MEIVFYFSGLVAVLTTLRVITHTQPVHALLYLITSIIAISCIFFLLGAYFVGALEIIIYASAIMVLFVFVVMMLNIDIRYNNQECTWLNLQTWIGPSIISLLLLVVLVFALKNENDHDIIGKIITAKTIGIAFFEPYVLLVELASMLLLAGLIVVFHLSRNEQL